MKTIGLNRNATKRLLKVTGLGIGIWGLTLLWPTINESLTPVFMIGLILALAVTLLVYIILRDFKHHHRNGEGRKDRPYSTPRLIQLNNHS
jgi:hypothetical protein